MLENIKDFLENTIDGIGETVTYNAKQVKLLMGITPLTVYDSIDTGITTRNIFAYGAEDSFSSAAIGDTITISGESYKIKAIWNIFGIYKMELERA